MSNLGDDAPPAVHGHDETCKDHVGWLALPFALLLFRKNLLWVVFVALFLPLDHPAGITRRLALHVIAGSPQYRLVLRRGRPMPHHIRFLL